MADSLIRWCLFCDVQVQPSHPRGPQPDLMDYVDALERRAAAGEALRRFENENRITRIADTRRVDLPDGSPALAFIVTLGDKRGAHPAFIHFDEGIARDAEKQPGEVRGASAHCLLKLQHDDDNPSHHRLLIEEVRGIGRTPITRLLASELKQIAEEQGEVFRDPSDGRQRPFRPVIQVHPRQSKEMSDALAGMASLPVTLIDTSPVLAFDESPEFRVRKHLLTVKVTPVGRSMTEAVQDLAALGLRQNYDRLRVSWRPRGATRSASSEMATDLADIGTALMAHRVEITLATPLSDCSDRLRDDFISAMAGEFS